jgi:hypothetical protein
MMRFATLLAAALAGVVTITRSLVVARVRRHLPPRIPIDHDARRRR